MAVTTLPARELAGDMPHPPLPIPSIPLSTSKARQELNARRCPSSLDVALEYQARSLQVHVRKRRALVFAMHLSLVLRICNPSINQHRFRMQPSMSWQHAVPKYEYRVLRYFGYTNNGPASRAW